VKKRNEGELFQIRGNEASGTIATPRMHKPTDVFYSVKRKGICLHASSVNMLGKALLFLGHSTAGKSTISRLLSERYPVIADDKVWVCRKKTGWVVRDGGDGSPYEENQSRSVVDQGEYPLLAVFRIYKSEKTGIRPLSPIEACRHLVDAIFEVDCQRQQNDLEVIKQWFASVVEISKNIECWRLTFKKDKRIIKMIYDEFEIGFFEKVKWQMSAESIGGNNEKDKI